MALIELPLLLIPGPQEFVLAKWALNTIRWAPRILYYGTGMFVAGSLTFVDSVKKAKLTGRLIAIALVLGYPFTT